MAVTPGSVGMGGADGIAVACFAIDLFVLVAIDGVIADEGKGAIGEKMAHDESCQQAGELKSGPGSGGEDALVAGLVAPTEGAECSQEVGDGASSGGEQSGSHEDGEA